MAGAIASPKAKPNASVAPHTNDRAPAMHPEIKNEPY
jgi:hypothetical protein